MNRIEYAGKLGLSRIALRSIDIKPDELYTISVDGDDSRSEVTTGLNILTKINELNWGKFLGTITLVEIK